MQAHITLRNATNSQTTLLLARVGVGQAHDILTAAATLAVAGESEISTPFLQPLADDAKGSEKEGEEEEEEGFGDEEEGDDDEDELEEEDEFEDDEDEFFEGEDDDDEFDDDADDEDDEDEDF